MAWEHFGGPGSQGVIKVWLVDLSNMWPCGGKVMHRYSGTRGKMALTLELHKSVSDTPSISCVSLTL